MITKSDIVALLMESLNERADLKEKIHEVMKKPSVDMETLEFVSSIRPLDVMEFYEHIRKSYNKGRSSLYINIMKQQPEKLISTLSALLNQIVIYSAKVSDPEMFLRHSRAKEISDALSKYFTDFDLEACIQLLFLVKCDIKLLETLKNS